MKNSNMLELLFCNPLAMAKLVWLVWFGGLDYVNRIGSLILSSKNAPQLSPRQVPGLCPRSLGSEAVL